MESIVLIKKCFSWLKFLKPAWNYLVMWFKLPFDIKRLKKSAEPKAQDQSGFRCDSCGSKMKIVKTEPFAYPGFELEPETDREWAYYQCIDRDCFRAKTLLKVCIAGNSASASEMGIKEPDRRDVFDMPGSTIAGRNGWMS